MKPCDHLSPYLDGRLERAGRDYFETHLHICSGCRDVVTSWTCAKNGLRNEAVDRRKRLTPTDEEAAKVVEWAILDQSSRGPRSLRVLLPVTAAISFSFAFWIAAVWRDDVTVDQRAVMSRSATPEVAAAPRNPSAPAVLPLEYETTASGHTTGRLGRDRFGLAPASKLSVVSTGGSETVLNLEAGSAVFQVSKRRGDRIFVVEAGSYRVRVVGTRFSVQNRTEGVRVAVVEGIVEVSEGRRGWRLMAGEALSVAPGKSASREATHDDEEVLMARLLGEMPLVSPTAAAAASNEGDAEADMRFELDESVAGSPKRAWKRKRGPWAPRPMPASEESISLEPASVKEASPEDLSEDALSLASPLVEQGVDLWRQWILDGRFEAAEVALVSYLEDNPVDTDAYSLLADCRRKAGKYAEAIDAYKKLTAIAGEHQANRARFKAGVLLQENLQNHLAAAAIFDEYLATGKGTPLLRAKATIRLARSLIMLGETDRARVLLNRVVSGYSGSSVAIQAREILYELR